MAAAAVIFRPPGLGKPNKSKYNSGPIETNTTTKDLNKDLRQFNYEAWSQAPPEIFIDIKTKILYLLIIKYFSELNTSADEIKTLISKPEQLKENLLIYINAGNELTYDTDLDELKDTDDNYKNFNSIFYITFDGFKMRRLAPGTPLFNQWIEFPYNTFLPRFSNYYDYYSQDKDFLNFLESNTEQINSWNDDYPVAFVPYLEKHDIKFEILNKKFYTDKSHTDITELPLFSYSIVYLNAVKNCGKLPTKNNNFIKRHQDFINQTKELLNEEGGLEKALIFIKDNKTEIDDIIAHLTIFNDPKKKGTARSKESCRASVRFERTKIEQTKYRKILDIIAGENVPIAEANESIKGGRYYRRKRKTKRKSLRKTKRKSLRKRKTLRKKK